MFKYVLKALCMSEFSLVAILSSLILSDLRFSVLSLNMNMYLQFLSVKSSSVESLFNV